MKTKTDTVQALQRGILGYILSLKNESDDENLGVAFDCLKEAFAVEDVEASDALLNLFSGDAKSDGAADVVDEKLKAWLDKIASKGYFDGCEKGSDDYKLRHQKAVDKYNVKLGKTAAKAAPAPAAVVDSRTAEEKEAEGAVLKAKGNEAFKAGRNEEAVDFYEQAIQACPNGSSTHIFHCNKAAALQKTKQFQEAVDECEKALKLNAKYTKAYSRMGAAQYELRKFDVAADSYRHVLELEPTNDSAITQLKLCEEKSSAATTPTAGAGGAPGGMPDLSALAGMMGGAGGGGGAPGGGGMPDLSALAGMMGGAGGGGGGGGAPGGGMDFASMMQSPMMQQMAGNLMQNPQAMQMAQNMMQDPAMMQNMMGMMGGGGGGGAGGGGGMPDLSALAGMMGGAGASGTPGGDSSPEYKDTD